MWSLGATWCPRAPRWWPLVWRLWWRGELGIKSRPCWATPPIPLWWAVVDGEHLQLQVRLPHFQGGALQPSLCANSHQALQQLYHQLYHHSRSRIPWSPQIVLTQKPVCKFAIRSLGAFHYFLHIIDNVNRHLSNHLYCFPTSVRWNIK